ncbi:MAG: dTMP kinase, partial [bacterium]
MFVVIEGPEGAGKSTLVRWLAAQLLADGRQVVTVREPGGTPVAEAARKLALKSRHEMALAAELFLVLAARADLVERVIRPALEAGQVVLADRFDLSTLAYQVAGRGLPRAEVEAALRLATGAIVPDLTVVLDVPVAIGRER